MKPFRHLIARIALLALLLNAFIPFFATYHAGNVSPETQEASLFGDKVLLCTAEGFKWVKIADMQNGKTPRSHYQCPLCYLAAHGLAHALPHAETVVPHRFALSVTGSGYEYFPAATLLHGTSESRAPPVIAA